MDRLRVAREAGEAHPRFGDRVVGVVDGEQMVAPEHRREAEVLDEPRRFEEVGVGAADLETQLDAEVGRHRWIVAVNSAPRSPEAEGSGTRPQGAVDIRRGVRMAVERQSKAT